MTKNSGGGANVTLVTPSEDTRSARLDGERVGFVRIPIHLMPILRSIARRQRTTIDVIIAQAIRDYCEGGL